MGTTAEKGARVLQSIAEVQEGINNLGGSLTDQTPFKDFKTELDNIYDNAPKTSFQESTDVTIENGLKGKLDFEDGKVGFGQASQESTTGKNKYDFTKDKTTYNGVEYECSNTYQFKINGTANANGTTFCKEDCVLPAGDYVFQLKVVSGNIVGNGNIEFIIGNHNGSGTYKTLYVTDNSNRSGSFTLTSETTIRMKIYVRSGSAFTNAVINLGVISGTVADHTYEEYSGGYASPSPNWEQPIQCVTGNQDVVVSGKNKCDGINQNIYLNTAVNQTGRASGNSGLYMLVKGGNYTISTTIIQERFRVACINSIPTDVPQTCYKGENKDNTSSSITIDTTGYSYLIVNATDLSKIQIEKGATATDYEPYHTPITYPISLGSKQLYDECYIVGSPDNWKFVDKLKYIKVTSDFTISKSGSTANVLFNVQEPTITNEIETPATNNTVVLDIYCNIAKGGYSANQLYASNIIGISINIYKAIQLGLGANSEINTVEKLKTYLDNNDVYFIYPLRTPIETPITDTTLITQLNNWYYSQSFTGTTIIESNGDLPMIIKVRALKGE